MSTDRRGLDGPVSSQTAKFLSSWRGRAGVLVAGALCAVLLLTLLSSPARATSFAWTSCMDGGTPEYQTAPSGPVSAGISCGGWGDAQASADDLAQAMAAHAQGSGSTTAEEADAEARMTTTLTVLPGTSGLRFGAPVTLRFVVDATGSGSASAGGPANSYGYVDGTVLYNIKSSLDPFPNGTLLARFTAGIGADAWYSSNLNSTDYLVVSSSDYYNALTDESKEYYSTSTATLPPGSGFGSDNFIDFDTTVCAVLHLDAQIWEQAGGGPNIVGQSGPAGGSVSFDPVTASFTPAPGCSCDALELVIGTVEHPALWRNGESDLGGGWKWLDWFGYYSTASEPWIYHQEHQWLYPYDDGACGVFFWYDDMQEFVWTNPATYPYFYRFGDNVWLWYQEGSANPRWFYNLTAGAWEELP